MANDDDGEDLMDLDLNLEPSSTPSSHLNSIDERIRRLEEVTRRSRHQWRILTHRRTPSPPRAPPPVLLVGEGSVSQEERTQVICKNCRGRTADLIAKALNTTDEDGDGEKETDGSSNNTADTNNTNGFFDCNVCFDMASDPVLTTCGHLFCWACLYQWLHLHSHAKECPVCKGEVTDTNITPIYGRGTDSDKDKSKGVEEEGPEKGFTVPLRPKARRIESLRQSVRRVDSSFSVQEIIQRIGTASRILSIREVVTTPENAVGPELPNPGTSNSSRRVLRSSSRSRGSTSPRGPDSQRGSNPALQRGASTSHLFSALSSAERLMQFFGNPMRRNETQLQSGEGGDSVPSIAAQSQGASMDIDSLMSLSSSDGSRVSDVETGVRRTRRRRRLN